MTTYHGRVAREIQAEREAQISREGWTLPHDDKHDGAEMALAAACYALGSTHVGGTRVWPWDREWWKPSDDRRNLVKAAALIIAEIERLDRAAQKEKWDHANGRGVNT